MKRFSSIAILIVFVGVVVTISNRKCGDIDCPVNKRCKETIVFVGVVVTISNRKCGDIDCPVNKRCKETILCNASSIEASRKLISKECGQPIVDCGGEGKGREGNKPSCDYIGNETMRTVSMNAELLEFWEDYTETITCGIYVPNNQETPSLPVQTDQAI